MVTLESKTFTKGEIPEETNFIVNPIITSAQEMTGDGIKTIRRVLASGFNGSTNIRVERASEVVNPSGRLRRDLMFGGSIIVDVGNINNLLKAVSLLDQKFSILEVIRALIKEGYIPPNQTVLLLGTAGGLLPDGKPAEVIEAQVIKGDVDYSLARFAARQDGQIEVNHLEDPTRIILENGFIVSQIGRENNSNAVYIRIEVDDDNNVPNLQELIYQAATAAGLRHYTVRGTITGPLEAELTVISQLPDQPLTKEGMEDVKAILKTINYDNKDPKSVFNFVGTTTTAVSRRSDEWAKKSGDPSYSPQGHWHGYVGRSTGGHIRSLKPKKGSVVEIILEPTDVVQIFKGETSPESKTREEKNPLARFSELSRFSGLTPLTFEEIQELVKRQQEIRSLIEERMNAIWAETSLTEQSKFIVERLKTGYSLIIEGLNLIKEWIRKGGTFDWESFVKLGRKILFHHNSALATANRRLGPGSHLYEFSEIDRVAYKLEGGKLLASYLILLSMGAMASGELGGNGESIRQIFQREITNVIEDPYKNSYQKFFSRLFLIFVKMQIEVFQDKALANDPSAIFSKIEKFFEDKPQLEEIVKNIVTIGRTVRETEKDGIHRISGIYNRYGDPLSRDTAQNIFWEDFFTSYFSSEGFQSLLTPFGRILGPLKQRLAEIIAKIYSQYPGPIFDIGTGITRREKGNTQMAVPGDVLIALQEMGVDPRIIEDFYRNIFLTDISGSNLMTLAEEVLPKGGKLGYWDGTHPSSIGDGDFLYVIASLSLHQLDEEQQREAYQTILRGLQEDGMFFVIGVSKETGWLQSLLIPHNLIDEEGWDLVPPGLSDLKKEFNGRKEIPLIWLIKKGEKGDEKGNWCLAPVPGLCQASKYIYDLFGYRKVFVSEREVNQEIERIKQNNPEFQIDEEIKRKLVMDIAIRKAENSVN